MASSVDQAAAATNPQRLRCGAVLTADFIHYLRETRNANRENDRLPTIEYVACATGPRKGQSWWNLRWISPDIAEDHELFEAGGVTFVMPLRTQRGLREKLIDFRDGQIWVT